MTRQLPFNSSRPLEMWGGVECTVNRVGDEYFDQLKWNGHDARIDDLDAFAALGLRTLRYPILWERVAPDSPDEYDWSWPDERLARLQALGIQPIVGLVHHGSGPRYTQLLDPQFPEKLARYARAVAERYPWLEYYTPVNEPLTTARFSGLYGHWFPHHCDNRSFLRMTINQCRAVALAMQEIRKVNPDAKLVQTEDMGMIQSTPALAYQAEFENERRWLSFDLLCGRVDKNHSLHDFLLWAGLHDEEWSSLSETPCPPDIIGLDYYLTSDRFLDEHREKYPVACWGSNGVHKYADVEAVRVCRHGIHGTGAILMDAWERYGLPLAITEAYLGCTREEQARWLKYSWDAAQWARRQGANVRAVTCWALLGTYNWDSLVTRCNNYYEPGAFDLRGGKRHPTVLAHVTRDLACSQQLRDPIPLRPIQHPVLDTPGWWRQDSRLQFPPMNSAQHPTAYLGRKLAAERESEKSKRNIGLREQPARPILIVGATGTLGHAFERACHMRHLAHVAANRRRLDITNRDSIHSLIDEVQPWAIINAAGFVRVDDAEFQSEECFRANAAGAVNLACECEAQGLSLLTFSSDLVFDGNKNQPYVEEDRVQPLNVYGQSKAAAEAGVLQALRSALVIRTSAFFGPWDDYNFATVLLNSLNDGRTFTAADDYVITPTYVPDLVHASLDLLIDGTSGVWHLSNRDAMTWAEFALRVAREAGADEKLIEARPSTEMGWQAPRPLFSALTSERGTLLPHFDCALKRYFSERAAHQEYSRAEESEAITPELLVNR